MSCRSTSMHTVSSRAIADDPMRGLLQHGREAEELSMRGLIDYDFLVILVDGRHPNHARDHDVGLSARIAHLIDSLPGSELPDFDLAGQYGGFFVVEQSEQRNVSQDFWIARHSNFLRQIERGTSRNERQMITNIESSQFPEKPRRVLTENWELGTENWFLI